ncbi:MAG TPA: bifunctional phosphoribosyl-AMP cyclohydrolase/phosphoribosyl-ATP diphosphatase HisIE [Candidatus Limnocylindrales bacterium]|nr:bifunctional phosphoribosyl-AMP cyclohydrolase/phosphoribosyl-ATP diphosphatase HisIE [Candidatus Limnocylindrales bacterium]
MTAAEVRLPGLRFGTDGLAPAIVQDVSDGRVLMLGWMDREALDTTLTTGEVHFHSRSRDRLWRKGETSGNVLRLRSVAVDCDADALLVMAEPAGPTCHTGERSCFDAGPTIAAGPVPTGQGFGWLETLWFTIVERATTAPQGSYTARLVGGGVDAAGRKVVEEATEVLIAAKDDAVAAGDGAEPGMTDRTSDALAGEAADLLYHLLVLLAERRLEPALVIDVLRARHRR